MPKLCHECDGLSSTHSVAIRERHVDTLLKWKFTHLNSVDSPETVPAGRSRDPLRGSLERRRRRGERPSGEFAVRGADDEAGDPDRARRDPRDLDGKIVKCTWDKTRASRKPARGSTCASGRTRTPRTLSPCTGTRSRASRRHNRRGDHIVRRRRAREGRGWEQGSEEGRAELGGDTAGGGGGDTAGGYESTAPAARVGRGATAASHRRHLARAIVLAARARERRRVG